MAHNVLSYGSPEAARRANRAINKIAQDGGFVGVKPTERRTHTAVASQGDTTVEYNGYFKIVDITEYYDADGKEISKPEYKIKVLDGTLPDNEFAGICQINSYPVQILTTTLSLDFTKSASKWVYLKNTTSDTANADNNQGRYSPEDFEIIAGDSFVRADYYYEVFYLIGDIYLKDNRLSINQRHGTTSFPGNGTIFVLRFSNFACEEINE